MFELFYKAGKSLADSFFVGKSADKTISISASKVLPVEEQKKIMAFTKKANVNASEAELNKAQTAAGIKSPEEIGKVLASTVKNFKGFEQFCKEAEAAYKERVVKASKKVSAATVQPVETTFAQEKEKPESMEVEAIKTFKDEGKIEKVSGSGSAASKVKAYYGGLGGKEVKPELTIKEAANTSLKDKYIKLAAQMERLAEEKAALEKENKDLGEKNKGLEKSLGDVKTELGKKDNELKEKDTEIENGYKSKDVDAIIKSIKGFVKIDEVAETGIKEDLSKVKDNAALKTFKTVVDKIASAIKKDKGDKGLGDLFGGGDKKEEKGGGDLPKFDDLGLGKAASKMPGANIPQVFSNYNTVSQVALENLFK